MPDHSSGLSPLDIIREQIKKLLAEREKFQERMDSILATVETRGGKNASLRKNEEAAFYTARDAVLRINGELKPLEEEREAMLNGQRARDAMDAASRHYTGSNAPVSVRVGHESGPYYRGSQNHFFRDLVMCERGDWSARDRLESYRRGSQREQRATVTGDYGALVPPQFLTELYASTDRPGRAFANRIRQLPLPPQGMTITVPLSQTASIVASQATQNTSVTSADLTTFDLEIPVITIAGQVEVSRQAIDRGMLVDELVMADLVSAYDSELERQIFEGTGASGTHIGILSTTSPASITSVPVLSTDMLQLPLKTADAIQRVNGSRHGAPDTIVMHPRRWGKLSSVTDGQGRPLHDSMGDGRNTVAGGMAAGVGVVGRFMGVDVLSTANIPTSISSSTVSGATEDAIIVCRVSDLLLFEESGGALAVRFDETLAGQLTSKIVAWGYSGFTAAWRTTATALLSGSGLTAPTF